MGKLVKNNLGNFLIILLIFSMIFSWFYIGWPRVWHSPSIPPKTPIVKADSQTYTSSNTWTVPPGVTLVDVECWGSGGAGGGGNEKDTYGGGGGGGGAYAAKTGITVTPEVGYNVVIGAVGSGGTGNGETGGDSYFDDGSEVNAKGGVGGLSTTGGGTGGAGGLASASTGVTKNDGGTGFGPQTSYTYGGGGGEGAGASSNGTTATNQSGGSGVADGGDGGNGGNSGANGSNGSVPGGGGGGGGARSGGPESGGDGAAGKCVLTWVAASADATWNTGAADFEIWESSTLTWDNGTFVCGASLSDDNGATVPCDGSGVNASTTYRVQAVVKEGSGGTTDLAGEDTADYVAHVAVKGGWAGTNPTLDTCGYNDSGLSNNVGSPACTAAFVGNDVRLTNGSASGSNKVVVANDADIEGFMYLITTDGNVATNSASYIDINGFGDDEDSSKITIGRTDLPPWTSVSLNAGADIILNEGTWKSVTTTISVYDADYCADIDTVSAMLYRADTNTSGTKCVPEDGDCYREEVACVATTTGDTCGASDPTVEYDCGFHLWYIATPTDVGAQSSQIWAISATTTDIFGNTTSATNTGELVEVTSISALNETSTINYGLVIVGEDTGSVNQETYITNTGNTAIDIEVDAETANMCDNWSACDGDNLAVTNQEFNYNSIFSFGEGTILTDAVQEIESNLPKGTNTTTPDQTCSIFWGIGIPNGTAVDTYTGEINMNAKLDD